MLIKIKSAKNIVFFTVLAVLVLSACKKEIDLDDYVKRVEQLEMDYDKLSFQLAKHKSIIKLLEGDERAASFALQYAGEIITIQKDLEKIKPAFEGYFPTPNELGEVDKETMIKFFESANHQQVIMNSIQQKISTLDPYYLKLKNLEIAPPIEIDSIFNNPPQWDLSLKMKDRM